MKPLTFYRPLASLLLLVLLALFPFGSWPVPAAEQPQHPLVVTDDKAYPPFAFLDAAGNPRGITIDIWKLWSRKTGIPVKFDLMEWDEALQAVRDGRADAVGGLFYVPERTAYLDYTSVIIKIPTAIFFHQQIAGIKGLADLSGFRVGVITGDSSEALLRTNHPDIDLLLFADTEELVRAAIAGQVKVFVADEPVALFYLSKYPGGEDFLRSFREIAVNPQHAAVRKGSGDMLAVVQSGFDRISDEEVAGILAEWSGLRTAPLLPWREIGLGLAATLILIVTVIAWNILLQRRVLKATRTLAERNRELECSREAIQMSEARYRELVEHANSIILRMDQEGRILFFNEFAQNFFGFKAEEVVGRNVVGTIVPEKETTGRDLDAMIRDIARHPDRYTRNENENMRRNGERVWIAWTNRVIQSAEGNVAEILCVGNDITERKQAEEALRQSEERFVKAFQSSPAPLVISEIETGRFIDVNEAWVRMLGYTRQEQIGRTSREVGIWMNPADRSLIVQKLRLQGSFKEEPIDFRTKTGRHVKALWSAETITLGTKHVMLSMLYDETERKNAEADLEFFKYVLESTRDCFFGVAADAKILYVNESASRTLGYTRDELRSMHVWDFDTVYSQETWPDFLLKLKQAGALLFESRLRRKDGGIFPVEISANMHRYREEEYIFAFIRDTSERVKMTEELVKAQGLLNAAFMQSPSGILIADAPDVRIKMANPAALGIRGAENHHLVGIDLALHSTRWQTFYPDGRPVPPEELPLSRAILQGETCRNIEVIIRNEQGEDRWVSANAAPIRDSNGNLIAGIVVFHDISEAKQLLATIRESEESFKAIFEESPFSITLNDLETGRYRDVNRFFCMSNHLKKDLIIGKTAAEIGISINPDDEKRLRELLAKQGRLDFEEIQVKGRDGKNYIVIISSRLIQISGKQQVLSALQDITERKHSEQAINKLQNQLRQTQKMEAIGTLAGGIAHDFNNILGSVMGYTELARMNVHDEQTARYLDQVLKASDRAKALVAQILTFSRQRSQEKKPLSATPIFREVLKLLRSSLPANIQIRQHFACPFDTILADATQIYQVLMNLCTNAAHALREEGGILEITVEPEHIPNPHMNYEFDLKEGDYLKLIVRDTGCGMEPSTIEHIFEPFFTTKKEGEGTGLGLSVVYGIVKDHAGQINVESRPGQGAVFTVLLPLLAEEGPPRAEAETAVPEGKGHILVVDDEEALANMAHEMLSSLGYEVTLRFSSPDALEAFRKNPFKYDLVMTDMTMPNMSGAALAREMLRIRPELPIILVTGFSEGINEEEAKRIGIREFLMKPVSLAILARRIKAALDQGPPDENNNRAPR